MSNSITQIVGHTFLLGLAFGSQLFAPVVSSKLTGVGFYKLVTTIALASLVLVFGITLSMDPGPDFFTYTCFGILVVSNIISLGFHKDEKSLLMWSLYLIQLLTFFALIFHLYLPNPSWIMFFMYSALLIGMSNFLMVLGHYYLVVPKLSEEPLIYCHYILWTVMLLRIVSSVTELMTNAAPYLTEGTSLGDGYTFNWLFVSMRYLWGYAAPLILSFFSFRLCKIRSTQSATGVLYIVEFFVIVGELISIYLMAKHGLSL